MRIRPRINRQLVENLKRNFNISEVNHIIEQILRSLDGKYSDVNILISRSTNEITEITYKGKTYTNIKVMRTEYIIKVQTKEQYDILLEKYGPFELVWDAFTEETCIRMLGGKYSGIQNESYYKLHTPLTPIIPYETWALVSGVDPNPEPKPVLIKGLTKDYNGSLNPKTGELTVGCQTVSREKLLELFRNMVYLKLIDTNK